MALNALIRGQHDSIMVPVPQYPLYSASVALYNGNFVGYELDESNGWSMDVADLQVCSYAPPCPHNFSAHLRRTAFWINIMCQLAGGGTHWTVSFRRREVVRQGAVF